MLAEMSLREQGVCQYRESAPHLRRRVRDASPISFRTSFFSYFSFTSVLFVRIKDKNGINYTQCALRIQRNKESSFGRCGSLTASSDSVITRKTTVT